MDGTKKLTMDRIILKEILTFPLNPIQQDHQFLSKQLFTFAHSLCRPGGALHVLRRHLQKSPSDDARH